MTDFQIYRPSLKEIIGNTPLNQAEGKLLAACKMNGAVSFGDGVPEEATPQNSIRGELIRYLMMGGCKKHPPNAQGVAIIGAVITGQLDLDGCCSPLDLSLLDCRFASAPWLTDAEIGGLLLSGSHMPGLKAQRLQVKRSVRLHDGFHATGLLDLGGARIGGQLGCNKGKFTPRDGPAFKAHGLAVTGGIFLHGGFHATGLVDFTGATIGRQLGCDSGEFHAGLGLQGVKIGEDLSLENVTCISGDLDLRNAKAGSLMDDLESWSLPKHLYLDGFHYGTLASDMSVSDRMKVLEKHADGFHETTFHSQPHTHLANSYQKNGQRQAAARVLYDREKRFARAEWAQVYAATDGTWKTEWPRIGSDFVQLFRWIFQGLAGFGHKPMWAFYWAAGVVAFSMIYFHLAYINGQMVPNSDIILTSTDWIASVAANPTSPVEAWSETIPGKDYETFSAIGYGFDLFIPLDALGQELAWAPSYARGWYGAFGHYLRWPIQVMGWMLTGIGAALLTGLIGRERE